MKKYPEIVDPFRTEPMDLPILLLILFVFMFLVGGLFLHFNHKNDPIMKYKSLL